MRGVTMFFLLFLFISTCKVPAGIAVKQQEVQRINQMPDLPHPLQIIDYRDLALRFDSVVYDFNASGKFWPLVWIDSSKKNFPQDVVGLYTAIGDARQGPENNGGMFHESLATMGAVLGATLVGIDKSSQQNRNYVGMLKNYFNKETGWNIMMNNTAPEVALLGGGYGRDWWYDVFPNVLFYAIYDLYPNEPGFEEIARTIAEQFYKADSVLKGNYDYSYFDYGKMKPMKNNICAQPDAAAGHAWVLYCAYKKFGDPRYLKGALSALDALQAQSLNPAYEVLIPFGAYLSARLNAELLKDYDVGKVLGWTFDATAICREGWGVLTGNWNGMDISGMVGSAVDHGGYGFLMNTYDAAWPLAPLVRYDQSYAKAIGKYMLNAVNVARLFYPAYMPEEHQTIPQLAGVARGVIGYEGIVRKSTYQKYENVPGPVAQGDGPLWVPGKNPEESQFSVYGSAHAGIFGSIVRETNVKGILQLDMLATDFYHDKAYPSYLYYNPYDEDKKVSVNIQELSVNAEKRTASIKERAASAEERATNTGEGFVNIEKGRAVDLYNTVSSSFIARNITASTEITIPARQAVALVITPSSGKLTYDGNKMLINGIIVNYRAVRE